MSCPADTVRSTVQPGLEVSERGAQHEGHCITIEARCEDVGAPVVVDIGGNQVVRTRVARERRPHRRLESHAVAAQDDELRARVFDRRYTDVLMTIGIDIRDDRVVSVPTHVDR